ncbi:MAG: hypothetical protein IJK89_07840 [Clostridia bacterium]|nr:hypothetical protein [Clostridia bacterium]
MRESRTENALKNSLAGLALRAVSILSRFILRTAFLRVLGNEYAGLTGVFTDILNVLALAQAGLESSLLYALYRPLAENDMPRAALLLRFYRRAFLCVGAGMAAAGVLVAPFLSFIVKDIPAVREDIRLIFLLFVLDAAASCCLAVRPALLKARQHARTVSRYAIAAECAECLLSVALLLVCKRFAVWLFIHLTVDLVKNALLWRAAGREGEGLFAREVARLDPAERRRRIEDTLFLTAYDLSGAAINSTDSIFISLFCGTAEVAVVGNYMLIVNSVKGAIEQVAAAVKPGVGNLAVTETPEKQRQIFRRMDLAYFCAACWGGACLFSLLNPFVGGIWMGPAYQVPDLTAALITLNFHIAVMVYPVEAFRTANGLFARGWGRPIATAALNLLLDGALGSVWGVDGILLATAVSRVLTQVWFDPYLLGRYAFRQSARCYYVRYVLRAALASAVCAATWFVCSLIPVANVYAAFACRAVVSAVLPPLLLSVFLCRDPDWRCLTASARKIVKTMVKI